MVSIPVKYIVTTSEAIDNIPIIDGQVFCLSDRDGWFYDMGGERREASGDKYNFKDSETIEIKMNEADGNKIDWSANLKEHSVKEEHLQEGYLSNITAQTNIAIQAAQSSEAAASRSAASASTSSNYADESEDYAEESSKFASNASGYANDASGFASAANQSAKSASNFATEASNKSSEASGYAREANSYADESEDYSVLSQSWARGGTGVRAGEETNNAKYYAELARQSVQSLSGSIIPQGTILFEQLPDIENPEIGWMYNIANNFTTDDTFLTPNVYQTAGTDVYYTASGKWDCLVGSNVTGIKGQAETNYRQGNVNITKGNIGLGKVENLSSAEILNKIDIRPEPNEGEIIASISFNNVEYGLFAPLEIIYLTSAQYALLSEEDKMKDVLYGITDDNGGYILDDSVVSLYKTWTSDKIKKELEIAAVDEYVKVKSAPTSKAYLIGTTTAPTSTEQKVKGVADSEVYLDTEAGKLHVGSLTASGEIHAASVYSAVWNDFAEWFEKEYENETFEPGTIVAWSQHGVVKASQDNQYMVAGVCSDSYGYIVGGEDLENMQDNNKKFVPVALVGRVNVKVVGKVSRGDFIVPLQDGFGIAVNPQHYTQGTVVGKAIEAKNSDELGLVKIIVMLA